MPSVRVLYQPKPLQQNRATAEMESAHQLVEELAGPLFQMQAVAWMMELTPMAREQNPNKVGRLSSSLP